MCGYLGKFSTEKFSTELLKNENNRIICRGPDSTHFFKSTNNNVSYTYLFNRLSIIDLSEKANQPMFSEKFGTEILFNGEIFNHKELRKELENNLVNFCTNHSDTEVVLLGLSKYGSSYINKLRGQFSFVFHNKSQKTILFARDRMGQKPLYYSIDNNNLVFGSNFISVKNISKKNDINESSLMEYMSLGTITSPNTLINEIYKVCPGEKIEMSYSKGNFEILNKENYWNLINFLDNKKFNNEEFMEILYHSVKLRLESDVPIANFLSGGIDSTTIVKIMSEIRDSVNTFNVEIDNPIYDESYWAKLVSNKFNTNHQSIKIVPNFTISEIDEIINSIDEPYSDPSLIPSYLLSKEISKKYKVAISGDGADELLGGYDRVLLSMKENNKILNFFSKSYEFYPSFLGTGNFLAKWSSDVEEVYNSFLVDKKLINLLNLYDSKKFKINFDFRKEKYKNLMFLEYKYFFSDMMLFKVDRTSMANSLEIRSPFVDHKLIEYVFSHKQTNQFDNPPKKILKDYLIDDFGNDFINRKKKGFVFDVENWVFSNLNVLDQTFKNGKIVNELNPNILRILSINKSRINSHRLWRLYILEKYLLNI